MAKCKALFLNVSKVDTNNYEIEIMREGTRRTGSTQLGCMYVPPQGLKNLRRIINIVLEKNTKPCEGCTLHEDGTSPNLV
jgi:hypothetical protein